MTPLEEGSARRRDLYLPAHSILSTYRKDFVPSSHTTYRQHLTVLSRLHETSPVKVNLLTHTPAPRRHALLPVLPPSRNFPFSCTLSVDGIKYCLFPCGNTVFTGSDLDGTTFVPATYSRRPRQLTAADTLRQI